MSTDGDSSPFHISGTVFLVISSVKSVISERPSVLLSLSPGLTGEFQVTLCLLVCANTWVCHDITEA